MRRFFILHFINIKSAVYIVVMLCLVNVATTVMKLMTLAIAQDSQNQTHYQTTSNNKAPIVSLLANNLANRLSKSAAILEITSKLPEVKNHTDASSLNQTLHGIAADVDIQKRKIAGDILSADKDFGVIFFLCLTVICIWRNHIPVSSTSQKTTLILEIIIKEQLVHI